MDKRDKKRLKALRAKVEKLRLRMAGAKQQADDPGEVGRVQAEIDATQEAIEKLKTG